MVKFLKLSKEVIILQGQYTGRKVVIMRNFDDGTRESPYDHCLVAEIVKYSKKDVVTVDTLHSRDKKVIVAKETKSRFEERFEAGKNHWFFSKLRRGLCGHSWIELLNNCGLWFQIDLISSASMELGKRFVCIRFDMRSLTALQLLILRVAHV
ncbi:hypothetical protein Ancab_015160 [Ancistrocladus abbreviatus]